MYSDRKTIYAVSISVFVLLFAALFIPADSSRILAAILLIPAAAVTHFLVKKRSILSMNSRQVLLIMTVIALVYITLYFMTALYFGFVKNAIRFSFLNLLRYILPIAAIIISTEIIRSVLQAQNSKSASVFAYLLCVTAEVLTLTNLQGIRTLNQLMDTVGLTLFPAVIANLLYHYLSKRYGAKPNIVYRLLISLFPYIIPYSSQLPDSLYAFAKLIIPLLIYLFIDGLYERKRRYATKKPSAFPYIGITLVAVVMISFVMLISCQFRFGMLVIATESMTGEINKGDAIIYEAYDDQIILEGQVIVFRKDQSLIVHRVVEIQSINGVKRYYTKGDANKDNDEGYITDQQIVGLTNVKVPYLGYPTVWLHDIFS